MNELDFVKGADVYPVRIAHAYQLHRLSPNMVAVEQRILMLLADIVNESL